MPESGQLNRLGGLEPTAPGRLGGGDTGSDSVAARAFHLLVYIFLVPKAGPVNKPLELILLEFIGLVESALELLLVGLVLLLLEILFGLNVEHRFLRLA